MHDHKQKIFFPFSLEKKCLKPDLSQTTARQHRQSLRNTEKKKNPKNHNVKRQKDEVQVEN